MVEEAPYRFMLKRCGAPSTYEGVGDVFRLSKKRNVIGRNPSKTDFYLNSTVNKCLISRCHAEILLDQCAETGFQVKVLIKDSSLNGTFVNDVKIQGTTQLSIGDTITFGHLSGPGVKPGLRSPQPDSEFRFMLQEMSDSTTCTKSSMLNEHLRTFKEPVSPLNLTISGNNKLNVSPLPTQPPRTILKPVSPQLPNTKVDRIETPVQKTKQIQKSPVIQAAQVNDSSKVRSEFKLEFDVQKTKQIQRSPVIQAAQVNDSSKVRSEVRLEFDKLTSQGRAGMMVEVAGFAQLATSPRNIQGAFADRSPTCKMGIGANGQQQRKTPSTAASPLNVSQSICSTPHRKLQQKQIISPHTSKPLVYISPKSSTRTSPSTPTTSKHIVPTPRTPLILSGIGLKGNRSEVKSTSKDSGIYDDFRELDDEEEDMAVDSDGSDEDIFALASDIQAKVTNFTDDDDNFSAFIPDSQNNNDRDEHSPIPGLDSLDRNGSPVFERCASPVIELLGSISTQGLQSQQKGNTLATRNGGKRKTVVPSVISKKQKTKASSKQVKYSGVQYEKIEVCSSIDCCKPLDRKDTVSWVQCDDCDDWYHVDCVGCSYTKVKQSSSDFHCGCV